MARVRDYQAEYRRRIARGLAEGKTRQQARGHQPQEHVIRRTRRGRANVERWGEELISDVYSTIGRWAGDRYFAKRRRLEDAFKDYSDNVSELNEDLKRFVVRRPQIDRLEWRIGSNGKRQLVVVDIDRNDHYGWLFYH